MYIAFVNLLIGLSTGEESSQHCFVFLQNNGHFYDSHSSQNLKISLNHILSAFERYYDFFKMDQHQNMQQQNLNYSQSSVMAGGGSMSGAIKSHHQYHNKGIAQSELQGLISVCKLVTQIVKHNEKIRVFLFDFQYGDNVNKLNMYNQSCSFSALMFGLLTCPIPALLKGEIFKLLSNMCQSPKVASNTWQLMETSQVLQTASFASHVFARTDIKLELEEIEGFIFGF